jgi:hypothetical protein
VDVGSHPQSQAGKVRKPGRDMQLQRMDLGQLLNLLLSGGEINNVEHAWSSSSSGYVVCEKVIYMVTEPIPPDLCLALNAISKRQRRRVRREKPL